MVRVLAIIGATASGKSDLALQCAEHFNGEIVSCDSVQIYKYFNIGSAKPSLTDLQKIPHHLIDTLEPTQISNAGLWKDLAIPIVNDIVSRGKTPIIVGGTGLYLKALYLGMFEEKSRDQSYRYQLEQQANNQGLQYLYHQLLIKDPIYAQKISSQDQLRIIRALEAIHVTGKKFSDLHLYNVKPNWGWIFTKPILSRDIIYQRIEQRIYQMFELGLIDEVKALVDQFGIEVSPMKTIGYRHVLEFLQGSISKQDMIQKLILDTRHFAKRQETLFRSLIDPTKIILPNELLKYGEL